jgi:hypothetical protein
LLVDLKCSFACLTHLGNSLKFDDALSQLKVMSEQHQQGLETMSREERHARAAEMMSVFLEGAGLNIDDV